MGAPVLNDGPNRSTKRLDELDSLRGLVALSVMLAHIKLTWFADTTFGWLSPHERAVDLLLMPVTAGGEAIVLFFVFSGFVLSLPAINSRAQAYPVFVVRRILRIYLPYVAAVSLAALVNVFIYGDVAQNGFIDGFWTRPANWHSYLEHLIFFCRFDPLRYDPPIWTLIHEMRISLACPLLCAIALRMRPNWSLILAMSMSAVSMLVGYLVPSESGELSCAYTLHLAAVFVVGIYLARQRWHLSEVFDRLTRRRKIALAVLSVLLYIYGGSLWMQIVQRVTGYREDSFGDWPTVLGVVGIAAISLNSGLCRRFLLWFPVHALGKMSYSLYLVHFTVMMIFVRLLYGKLPLPVIFSICLVAAVLTSWCFYRLVEVPSIHLGRKFSRYAKETPIKFSPLRRISFGAKVYYHFKI